MITSFGKRELVALLFYARLKNGMCYVTGSGVRPFVRPPAHLSIRKLFRFRLTPTVYIVFSLTMMWNSAYCFGGYIPPNIGRVTPL